MLLKGISKLTKFGKGVVVRDGLTSVLPDVLLGVEVWRSRREPKNLDIRTVALQERIHGFAAMPGGSVPNEKNGCLVVGEPEHGEKVDGRKAVHLFGPHDRLLAAHQVECAIEVG